MTKTRETFTTPVGRLVAGDCFEAQTKDAEGRPEYIGYAPADALLTEAKWLIFKYIYDAGGFNTQKLIANGEAKFNKVWNSGASEYTTYTYTTT